PAKTWARDGRDNAGRRRQTVSAPAGSRRTGQIRARPAGGQRQPPPGARRRSYTRGKTAGRRASTGISRDAHARDARAGDVDGHESRTAGATGGAEANGGARTVRRMSAA